MIETTSELEVRLMHYEATDDMVGMAARVSTYGDGVLTLPTDESTGLINFLMKNRHGTPFEHNMFTFFVSAPIFVFREFHRHRIGFSFNEESGRYKELAGKFYIPPPERNLQQVGKPGAYNYVPGTPEQYEFLINSFYGAYNIAYRIYQDLLNQGIAKEVARMVLPVATYSSMWVTCNARSLMSFLSLRQKHEDATFPSTPMWEINQVANCLENAFRELMPITHAAFVKNGYVAP